MKSLQLHIASPVMDDSVPVRDRPMAPGCYTGSFEIQATTDQLRCPSAWSAWLHTKQQVWEHDSKAAERCYRKMRRLYMCTRRKQRADDCNKEGRLFHATLAVRTTTEGQGRALWANIGGRGGLGHLPIEIAYFGISRLKILMVVNKIQF